MRKNGSRLISIQQYRLTDLFIFAVILVLGEILPHFAIKWFTSAAIFTLSFMIPITLLVMMRWGWPSVFYALASGVIYCALNKGDLTAYLSFGIGNLFISLLLIVFIFFKKQEIAGKWYHSLWFTISAWVLVYLGRCLVMIIATAAAGEAVDAGAIFYGFAELGLLSLIMAVVIILSMRRFDGMFEDQITYLKRLDSERKERMRRDEFGDEPIEIDQETLDILNKDGGIY